MSKRSDRLIGIVHTLDNSWSVELVDNNLFLLTALAFENELCYACLFCLNLYTLIYIAVSMTCYSDRLFPVLYYRLNTWDGDRSTEHGAIKDRADSAVRALPHLV